MTPDRYALIVRQVSKGNPTAPAVARELLDEIDRAVAIAKVAAEALKVYCQCGCLGDRPTEDDGGSGAMCSACDSVEDLLVFVRGIEAT